MAIVKYTKECLSEVVSQNTTLIGVIRDLGLKYVSGNLYSHLRKRIAEYGIDTSHMVSGRSWAKGRPSSNKQSATEVLRRKSSLRREDTYKLRRALLEAGVKHECSRCPVGSEWMGEPLVLQIDHIDGDRSNHERENLRFLCPNCHSQTPTYGNKKKISRV